MSFYKNVNAQQDNELYNLVHRMSSSLVTKVYEGCQRKNIKTIIFRNMSYSIEQRDNKYDYDGSGLRDIGHGLPDELFSRNINVQGYDFKERVTELFTDYIYTKYLDIILDFKEEVKKEKSPSPILLYIRAEIEGYTQEYLNYEYVITHNLGRSTYIKDENGNLKPVNYTDTRSCPQIERFSVDLQGLYTNLETTADYPAKVCSSSRFISDYSRAVDRSL